jgi:hypothetical protein
MRRIGEFRKAADRSPVPAAVVPIWRRFSCYPPYFLTQDSPFGGASGASRLRLSANSAAVLRNMRIFRRFRNFGKK